MYDGMRMSDGGSRKELSEVEGKEFLVKTLERRKRMCTRRG